MGWWSWPASSEEILAQRYTFKQLGTNQPKFGFHEALLHIKSFLDTNAIHSFIGNFMADESSEWVELSASW